MIDLSKLVPNTTIMFYAAVIVEFVKIYLPDDIEPKVLPILSLIAGTGLGYLTNPTLEGGLIGFISGLAATSAYKIVKDSIKSIGNGR